MNILIINGYEDYSNRLKGILVCKIVKNNIPDCFLVYCLQVSRAEKINSENFQNMLNTISDNKFIDRIDIFYSCLKHICRAKPIENNIDDTIRISDYVEHEDKIFGDLILKNYKFNKEDTIF